MFVISILKVFGNLIEIINLRHFVTQNKESKIGMKEAKNNTRRKYKL